MTPIPTCHHLHPYALNSAGSPCGLPCFPSAPHDRDTPCFLTVTDTPFFYVFCSQLWFYCKHLGVITFVSHFSLRKDGISRTICGLPMVSPLSLSEVCSKFPGIKTFHLVGRLVQMQDVKEEVKHSTLQRSSTITGSTQPKSFRKSLKLTRFTTPQASISIQNC